MGYEVWFFERTGPDRSRLVSVATPPDTYTLADVERWAVAQVVEYVNMGMDVSTVVRKEGCY